MRLFVGIPVAPATERALHHLAARLRAGQDGLRWTPSESWHVTLQFLGETTAEQGSCIIGALREIKAMPVKIALERVASFERAGTVTVTVALTGSLRALQSAVTRASSQCGFVPEERPFSPHITLARVERGARFRPHGVLQEAMQRPL
ncbi:MAG: RNA 2',3'-cyclic phosphodiesterase, partial [Terracidiphilus sp.]